MRYIIAALALAVSVPAFAAGNAQQERMKTCNTRAGEMKGTERKTFMSGCLKEEQKKAANAQQERMKECNGKAKGMKGKERSTLMRACLRGEQVAPAAPAAQ